ncbi:unnamed protein product [Brassica rapa]|uniref:Uncharacterized protein n=1 Tax=Brassica campestris TaxID=3711 RepID=A0A8D9HLI6_BRACM|nr:unnamed protein product [Brassica rapa]
MFFSACIGSCIVLIDNLYSCYGNANISSFCKNKNLI